VNWIVLVFVVAVSLLQWWTKLNRELHKSAERSRKQGQGRESVDDLVEALGLPKTEVRPKPIAPVAPPKQLIKSQSAPEPKVRPIEVTKKVVSEPNPYLISVNPNQDMKEMELRLLEEQKKFSAETLSQAPIKQDFMKAQQPLLTSHPPRAAFFAQYLRSKSAIRDAIVINEILKPPLGLRDTVV
jgi:hypothetical protein